jgi:hypothetical protein
MSPSGLSLFDDVKLGWFLVDVAIFGALPVVGVAVFRMRRRRSSEILLRQHLAAIRRELGKDELDRPSLS